MENTCKSSPISLIARPLLILHSVSIVNMLPIVVKVFSVILVDYQLTEKILMHKDHL